MSNVLSTLAILGTIVLASQDGNDVDYRGSWPMPGGKNAHVEITGRMTSTPEIVDSIPRDMILAKCLTAFDGFFEHPDEKYYSNVEFVVTNLDLSHRTGDIITVHDESDTHTTPASPSVGQWAFDPITGQSLTQPALSTRTDMAGQSSELAEVTDSDFVYVVRITVTLEG